MQPDDANRRAIPLACQAFVGAEMQVWTFVDASWREGVQCGRGDVKTTMEKFLRYEKLCLGCAQKGS